MPPPKVCDKTGCRCDVSFFAECPSQKNPFATVLPIEPEPKKTQDLPKLMDLLQPGFQVCCLMTDQNRPRFGQFKTKPGFMTPPAQTPTGAAIPKPVIIPPAPAPSPTQKPPAVPTSPAAPPTDNTNFIVGGLAVAALALLGFGIYRNVSNRRRAAAEAEAEMREIELHRRLTILPPPPGPDAPRVPEVQKPPEAQQPPEAPEPQRVSTPLPRIEEWDQGELSVAFSEWQRRFDALPETEKPKYVLPWNYEELANQDLAPGDILPGQGFVLGEPAPYKKELVAADFGTDSRAVAVIEEARRIGEQGRSAGRPALDMALDVADLIKSKYADGQGGYVEIPDQATTLGLFNANGASPRHRAVVLQMALQEAGVQSRYVRGRMIEGSLDSWVEVDARGDGSYAYVINMNREIRGWKKNPASARNHAVFGNAEIFAIENDQSGTYIVEADKFNVVWRRRTPEDLARSHQTAFKILCEQLSVAPENEDLAADPAGRRKIARRAATHLVNWVSKPTAEREAIIEALPDGEKARFKQQRENAKKIAELSGTADMSLHMIPEHWIRQQPVEQKVCRQPEPGQAPQVELPPASIRDSDIESLPPSILPEQPRPAPEEAPPAAAPAPAPAQVPGPSWLSSAMMWLNNWWSDFIKGRGAEQILEAAQRSDNMPDDYQLTLDHPYSPPEPKPEVDFERTREVLGIQHQLKAYTAVTRHLDVDQQLAMARDLAALAESAGVKDGVIPHQIVDAVFSIYQVPTKSVGEISMGSMAPTEFDALIARRIQSVKGRLGRINEWYRRSNGNVEALGDWYGKQNPVTQEFLARLIVIDGQRPEFADSVLQGVMFKEHTHAILKSHGFDVWPNGFVQVYNHELWEVPPDNWKDASAWNEARLLFDKRVQYVANQFNGVPELADAEKRREIATDIVMDDLMIHRPDGILPREAVAQMMKKHGIEPKIVENVRTYPGVEEERYRIYAEHQCLMDQIQGMTEFGHLSPDEISVEAEQYLLVWRAQTESARQSVIFDPNQPMGADDFLPKAWIRARQMRGMANRINVEFGVDMSEAVRMIEEDPDGETELRRRWVELSAEEKAVFKGGLAEFELRICTMPERPAGATGTVGVLDPARERFEGRKELSDLIESSRRFMLRKR